jgi:hypothetical protein
MKYALIKSIQYNIENYIIWPKNLSKGQQTKDQAYVDSKIKPKKRNTLGNCFFFLKLMIEIYLKFIEF